MPELPEVEVLVRHLSPLLKGKVVRGLRVRRAKVLAPRLWVSLAGRSLEQSFPVWRGAGNISSSSFGDRAAARRCSCWVIWA